MPQNKYRDEDYILDGYLNFYDSKLEDSSHDERIRSVKRITERNGIEKFLGAFLDESPEKSKNFKYSNVIPGIHVPVNIASQNQDIFEEILEGKKEDYEFVELNSKFRSPVQSINETSEIIDMCLNHNFTKFQIYTNRMKGSFLEVLEEKIKENDEPLFYLVHGAHSLFRENNGRIRKSKIEKVRRMEENIFLGTSPGEGAKIVPDYVKKSISKRSISKGLEDLLVFESGFNPERDPSYYENEVTRILYSTNSYRNREKIFSKNIQPFLE